MMTLTPAEAQERKAVFERVALATRPTDAAEARKCCCEWLAAHPDDLGIITAVQDLVRVERSEGAGYLK